MYIDEQTLSNAIKSVFGTAGHLIKIWFVLKHMGLGENPEGVEIDTSNSKSSLVRLFSCGDVDGRYFIPFAHTTRYMTMKHDAARSIIQTTIQRWSSSGSVVTCDPTSYLDISQKDGKLVVKTARKYPFGLGIDESGFALQEGVRVSIPIQAFSVWYGRQTNIPHDVIPIDFLVKRMLEELNITDEERKLIFIEDTLSVSIVNTPISDDELFEICSRFLEGKEESKVQLISEDFNQYTRRVKSMTSGLELPKWLRTSPEEDMRSLLESGEKAILLYGPPRTGKTRLIKQLLQDQKAHVSIIQIHDGWTYDNLVQGLKPDEQGNWKWESGPLKEAIDSGKKYIVLEEINRTTISQSLGEVFSLIETCYRGPEHSIEMRSKELFFIPEDVIFIFTMNTIDKSTEDIDDALIGRVACVQFPPRVEDLFNMLITKHMAEEMVQKLSDVFSEILLIYPLGHGYFSGINNKFTNYQIINYYKSRIRPVLINYLGEIRGSELDNLDNLVDELFGK